MKQKWFSAVCVGCLVLTGCTHAVEHAEPASSKQEFHYHKIDAKEAKAMMEKKEVTIVDVRTKEEYAQGHIQLAINIPNETIASQMKKDLPNKGAVLLVYCRTGVRSKQASDQLVAAGYTNVYDFGGIVDCPYDVVRDHV